MITLATIAIMSYVGNVSLPMPNECVATPCEAWMSFYDGSLVCFEDDELYPAGHWALDGQTAIVEY